MMHGCGKSDFAIVAEKPANKAEQFAAESVEPRAETKGNANQQSTCRAQNRISVSQAPDRMRQLLAVWTRGGSRMRESRTYGSVRGARDETRVPTATWQCRLMGWPGRAPARNGVSLAGRATQRSTSHVSQLRTHHDRHYRHRPR